MSKEGKCFFFCFRYGQVMCSLPYSTALDMWTKFVEQIHTHVQGFLNDNGQCLLFLGRVLIMEDLGLCAAILILHYQLNMH